MERRYNMIKIHNTLTREKEIFKPIEENKVRMYVCGPTVYNYIHIGNARSTIAFDVIRRYFEYRGYEVNFVSNFTDVDDKIIKAAKELSITAPEVADRFIAAFEEDTAALNVKPATLHPRVINHIPDILAFIETLIEKGYAYEAHGDVYYRTRKFEHYGELSDQSIDELEVGASQRTGAEQAIKEDPLDFALWKSAKPDEISWESPWGEGRPGWHIECSVMATKHLGDTIDIHGGGQDLEFPHHENEIAQSEAKTGQRFANYWMHNGYVTIGEDDAKMSKSLGNFVTVHDLVKEIDPQVLRFFMATTQYRRPIRYSEATMKDAQANLQKLRTAFENAAFRQDTAEAALADDQEKTSELQVLKDRFVEEMDDDFNAANGITVVYELAKWLNNYSDQEKVSAAILTAALEEFTNMLNVFGIEFQTAGLLDEEIDQLIEERNQARKDKNFARSDEIRDQLKEQGIILEDTPQGVRWRRA
jgi:cysteinyl-tRNA synthetase